MNVTPIDSVKKTDDHLAGLPEELLEELSRNFKKSGTSGNAIAQNALEVLGDKTLSIDEILVEIYKTKNAIIKRANLLNTLSKMVKEGIIKSESRGEYSKPKNT